MLLCHAMITHAFIYFRARVPTRRLDCGITPSPFHYRLGYQSRRLDCGIIPVPIYSARVSIPTPGSGYHPSLFY